MTIDTENKQTQSAIKATLISQYANTSPGEDISHLNEQQRANLWIVKGNVGSSSKCIWAHMTGTITSGGEDRYPRDLSDFNRCLLLLEAVPEWKARIHGMGAHGPAWDRLASNWDRLTESMIDEAGLNFSKGHNAPLTSALFKQILNDDPPRSA
jgi:hypothetical protein